jgi:MGT family glycosyltransferase
MGRFLFVVPPLTGHINPTVAVGQQLARRGHQVAWVGHRQSVERLLPADAQRITLDDELPEELASRMSARAAQLRGAARLKFLWEDFLVPLARAMRPGVDRSVASWRPDALIVDQQTVAGSLVARQRGLPWATLATTSAGVTDPLAVLPRVRAWQQRLLAELQREVGLVALADAELSHHLVIAFTTRALLGDDVELAPQVRLVGPSLGDRPEGAEFPWNQLNGLPRVLVSLGTVNAEAGTRFYRHVVEGLGGQQVQVVLVAPPERVGRIPDNFIVRDYVPQLALLPHMHVVVSHGGHNTVAEALAHGRPMVVAPIKDDQPIVAQQVVDAGAGIRIKFGRVRPLQLREAVTRVLSEPEFGAAAERVRQSFSQAGGAARAAALVEDLL